MSFRADLHCHSTCSDGSLSPEQLVDLAVVKGLQGLSITDHDTVASYPHIIDYAASKGIKMITGVEFSSHFNEKSVHILGYGFDPSDETLLALCARHQERRKLRNLEILKKLESFNLPITEEELYAIPSHTIGRPHIALLMVQKGYVPDFKRAFNRYLGDGKKCFVPGPMITVEETLAVIKKAGGKAVIAHPHLYSNKKFVRKVLELGFDGIECDYACFSLQFNMPWHTMANEFNLIHTGGSDFHGDKKPGIPLGASSVSIDVFQSLDKNN
jgi:predicted metal-dependent phosphoesterase TrpH